jgi:acetylxylan esterase
MSLILKNGLPRTALHYLAPAALLSTSLLSSSTASAASLQGPISGWQDGSEPGNITMHIYVPDNLAANPPILVLLHYCGSNATGVFGQANGGGMVSMADQNGFIIVVPYTTLGCWDVATPQSLTHDGGGHTGAIVHMVNYAVSQYGGNADRVYAVGTSGGAMAMQGLLAVYPDVFKAGAGFSGVPAGCWAVGNADGSWSSDCAGGSVTHTAQEWGDMVRDMYPGYTGFRPRVQIYHATPDSTISFVNQTEAVKQWTNVMGLSETPTETSSVNVGTGQFDREEWKDDCGTTLLDVLTEPNPGNLDGGGHNTNANMNGQEVLPFLGLDVVGAEDPYAASGCAPTGGGEGSGGADGAGGSDTGAGGSDVGGGGSDAGAGGSDAGGSVGAGGAVVGAGGATVVPGAGGAVGAGGASTTAGGTAGVATGGTSDPGAGGTTDAPVPGSSTSEKSGCSFGAGNTSLPVQGFALAGLFALMFARRRNRLSSRLG